MKTIKTNKSVLSVLLLAALSLSALPAARAATWYVATTGNDANSGTAAQPFRTIAKGITAAAGGDTVLVAAGTYAEHISWSDKSLTLKGAGASQSIILGEYTGACLTLNNVPSTARMEGFNIANGTRGMHNVGSSPTIANCAFSGNDAGRNASAIGGGMLNQNSNPTVTNCTFTQNYGFQGGGMFNSGSSPTLINCTFTQNGAITDGGGMYNSFSNPRLINCSFFQNRSNGNGSDGNGGGMLNVASNPVLTHCTLTRNVAGNGSTGSGGGIFNQGSVPDFSPKLNNCIVWGNLASSGPSEIGGIVSATVTYSDVQNGYPGTGNINADPLFVNFLFGDNHLQAASPCIDKGNAAAPNLPGTDLDGAPRILGGAPDMGAYESTVGVWFVDKASGSDANSGTPVAPFATVSKAITVAANGNSIYMKQGTYGTDKPRITKSLRLLNWNNTGQARIGAP